jgi:hypothetical protein
LSTVSRADLVVDGIVTADEHAALHLHHVVQTPGAAVAGVEQPAHVAAA